MYPAEIDLQAQYKDKNIADLCLPDGAHEYEEDVTFVFLPALAQQIEPDVEKPANLEDERLFGMVLFRNKRDAKVKRGAIQKSIVLLSFSPYFSVWEPLMRTTILR